MRRRLRVRGSTISDLYEFSEEINGLMTYDREENKFVEEELKEIHAKLYRVFEEMV